MEKTIQILVKNNIEPPLLCSRSYYNIDLPENVKVNQNQFKQVDLNFQIKATHSIPIKATHSIPIQILSDNILTKFAQPLGVYRELINTSDTEYKKAVVNFRNREDNFRYFITKNTETARLYLFVAKEDIIYTKHESCDSNKS